MKVRRALIHYLKGEGIWITRGSMIVHRAISLARKWLDLGEALEVNLRLSGQDCPGKDLGTRSRVGEWDRNKAFRASPVVCSADRIWCKNRRIKMHSHEEINDKRGISLWI